MDADAYPALYRAANDASGRHQQEYLALTSCQYISLIICSVLALGLYSGKVYNMAYMLAMLTSTLLLALIVFLRPEQDWYICRALAESIKTATWRYMMHAEPFLQDSTPAASRAEFRTFLQDILRVNQRNSKSFADTTADSDQITAKMTLVRNLSLEERKNFYLEHRIEDQRRWYVAKALINQKKFKGWISLCFVLYAFAIIAGLSKIANPDWTVWYTEPLIAGLASAFGWIQLKRFSELASAYNLTANEISILKTRLSEIEEEKDFSEFVNEAERAFSREHTQWIARRQSE